LLLLYFGQINDDDDDDDDDDYPLLSCKMDQMKALSDLKKQ